MKMTLHQLYHETLALCKIYTVVSSLLKTKCYFHKTCGTVLMAKGFDLISSFCATNIIKTCGIFQRFRHYKWQNVNDLHVYHTSFFKRILLETVGDVVLL